jgi:hypothetical protein
MKYYFEWYISKYKKNNNKIDENFLEWIKKVENKILLMYGISLLDLPDENYMDYYEKKLSPELMADEIFQNNKI